MALTKIKSFLTKIPLSAKYVALIITIYYVVFGTCHLQQAGCLTGQNLTSLKWLAHVFNSADKFLSSLAVSIPTAFVITLFERFTNTQTRLFTYSVLFTLLSVFGGVILFTVEGFGAIGGALSLIWAVFIFAPLAIITHLNNRNNND